MTKRILYTITGIGPNIRVSPPEKRVMSVRRQAAGRCGFCSDKIAIGEQYFMLNYPVCLGCAKYE